MIIARRSFLLGAAATVAATTVLAKVPQIVTPTVLNNRLGKRRIIDLVASASVGDKDYPTPATEMIKWSFYPVGGDPIFQMVLNWRATYRWVPVPDCNVVIDPAVGFAVMKEPAYARAFLTLITDDGFGKKYTETFEWNNGVLVKQGFEPH